MNTSASTSGNTAISELIAKVMDKFDTDKDSKLSANEFSNFLSGLIGGTGPVGSATTPVAGDGAGVSAAQRANLKEYRGMLAGFDHVKIDNPDIRDAMTSKYQASRIFQNFKPMPENLPAVVAELRAQGFNATQTDHDKIDFGDGYGPIDVIQGSRPGGGVAWQWLPRE